MKNILNSVWLLLLCGCASYQVQVLETKSTNTKIENQQYIFENDTLKITYAFWYNKGVMAYTVYNKLNVPIYIDWKKSSFISNDNKFDYWVDEEKTASSSYYGSYFYKGYFPFVNGKTVGQSGASSTTSKTTKPERITSLPPRSKIDKAQLILFPFQYFPVSVDNTKKNKVPRKDKPTKETTIYETEYSSDNSPLKFRNYLVISTSEKFEKEFYTDNEFYVSKITEMDDKYYSGKLTGYNNGSYNEPIYEYPFKNNTFFFLSPVPNMEGRPQKNGTR